MRAVFSSTALKTSEDSFETHLKILYADREKRQETLQGEENLPNFHVDFVELFEGIEQELEQDEPDSSPELDNFFVAQKSTNSVKNI